MPLWGTAAESHVKKAQILLNSAARWVTGHGKSTRVSILMTETNWYTVREQVYISTLTQVWKLVHLRIPPRMLESMRVGQDLLIETNEPRLLFSSECYRWKSAKLWNSLEPELREIRSIGKFKIMLKRKVLGNREQLQPD